MVNYGLYTRKSSDDRARNEKSIGEQLSECHALAEQNGLWVPREWEESKSARFPQQRPKYAHMISLIESGELQGILCWHVNRLVRNMEEGGKLAQLLIDGRIKEIRTPHAIYRNGDNIMPLVIEAASATQYSLDLSRVVSRGGDGAFRAGGCTNRVVQGYRNTRNPDNLKQGMIVRDEERFETVHRALQMFLTGNFTPQEVRKTMNDVWGFTTRPSKKRGGVPLSASGIYSLLRNPFYAGFVQRKGELVKGKHEAMITVEDFEQIQRFLRRHSFSAPRIREYPFTGIMHCALCGHQITAEVKRLSNGKLWENYRCSDPRQTCTKKGIAVDSVRKKLMAAISGLHVHPEALKLAVDEVLSALDHNTQSDAIEKSQKAALTKTTQRMARLEGMWLDGLIDDPNRYKELEREVLTSKNTLTTELSRAYSMRQRMRTNLKRAETHLNTVAEGLHNEGAGWHKEFFRALAVGYRFDGHRKTISMEVAPVLKELVSFAKELWPIELMESGSYKPKEMPRTGALLYGGSERKGVELPSSLITALQGELIPALEEHSAPNRMN